ncbi:head-tail connector protein [Cytobacillus oceanisediminis]|uniref:head-tail connector protein n=1 Tax=Cytobacillus oceanisediminis TaxID=665099 RepID=UPI00203A4773|nr:head-tail connector protein [Cytobacillus oceanisediminis]MCM3242694.1 head-tail connector protein [Cytobacillus oceanisediminis]
MIIDLAIARKWLREPPEEDNDIIKLIIGATEEYLKNATGRTFDDTNNQARLFCLVLVTDWYENRDLIGTKPSEKVRFSIQSMLIQLQNLEEEITSG